MMTERRVFPSPQYLNFPDAESKDKAVLLLEALSLVKVKDKMLPLKDNVNPQLCSLLEYILSAVASSFCLR